MRTRFKLLVHEAKGQSYEDLFVKVMSYADVNFKPVKAHGNLGDRGNDGWNSIDGRYYQSYAPENLPNNTEIAIKKLKADFAKLKNYWDSISPVKEFVLVVNDKFNGVSPHITKAITDLKEEHNLLKVDVMGAINLENLLFSLPEDKIAQIVGHAAGENINPHADFYNALVNFINQKLNLSNWIGISENLIANGIEDKFIDSFYDFTSSIFRTEFPGSMPDLEKSIQELSNRVQTLIEHFTKSNNAYLLENGTWWKQDLRWKKSRTDQTMYQKQSDESERWRKSLFQIHCNLVHALNLYACEVRKSINNNYFMNQSFIVSDSLGVYNAMVGYQHIPQNFVEIN